MGAAVRVQPGTTEVAVGSATVPAHTLWLGGTPRGAVLLLRDPATTDYDVAEALNALATRGYETLAIDHGAAADDPDAVDALVVPLTVRGWGPEQIALIGFGAGGVDVLFAAVERTFGAAVSVAVSGLDAVVAVPTRLGTAGVRTPWLGMVGAEDASGTWPVLSALTDALRPGSAVYTELVRYPGVAGGFYRDSPDPLAHAASFDAWQRTVEWLDARVEPRPTALAEAWRLRQLVSPDRPAARHERGIRADVDLRR